MKSENFIVIQGWMCNELELKGNDLLVFALIYGFSQDGESCFSGSRNYIANTFNISKPTVDKAISNLLDKQYIIKYKSENSEAPNMYSVNIDLVKKLYWGSKETLLGGGKETLLNNNSNKNIKENNKVLSKDNTTKSDFQFGKQKPKKESLYTKCINLIDAKTTDKEIRTLLIDWLNMLLEKYKDRNKTLYINVFKGKLNTIDEYDKKDWKNVIEYNLQRGYEAFYPPKNFNNAYLNESGTRCVPNMTEEDYIRQEEYLREMEEKGVQVRF